MTLVGNNNPRNNAEKELEELENLYLNTSFQAEVKNSEVLRERSKTLAKDLGLDDAKMLLIRKKGSKLYSELKTEEEKLEAMKRVNDALIFLKNIQQGYQIQRNIDLSDLSEEERMKKSREDLKYISPKKIEKVNSSESRGLKARVEKLNINFLDLMDRVRNS